MTPKQAVNAAKEKHPECSFRNACFVHDGMYMCVGHPNGSDIFTSIGQVYAVDPKTAEVIPYAPHGGGQQQFKRWYESSKKMIYL